MALRTPGILFVFLGMALTGAGPVNAEVAAFHPMADTVLFELAPSNNLGAVVSLPVGTINQGKRCRLLVRFDLAGVVPTGAQIIAASLTLNVQRGSGPSSTFQVHRMHQPWNEGAQAGPANAGEPAGAGEVTWAHRAHPDVPWTVEGGQPGSDFATDPSTSLVLGEPGDYRFPSTPLLVADAQLWLDQPVLNHGWMVLSAAESTAGTSRRITSREDAAARPVLEIEYAPPPPGPRFDGIERAGDEIRLHFAVEAGRLYAVGYTPAVSDNDWQILGYAASKFHPTNWVMTDSRLSAPGRIYRLEIVGDID